MSEGFEKGLRLIEAAGAAAKLDEYYFFHAAQADLLRRLERSHEAEMAYSCALELTANEVERKYIRRRLSELKRERRQ